MQTLLGLILTFVFVTLAGIHFYWGLGGKWGLEGAIPITANSVKARNPGIIACFAVGLAIGFVAFFVLIKADLVTFSMPTFVSNYGLLILSGVFLLRAIGDFKYAGFTKKIHQGLFASNDTKYYSPLCLLISLALFFLNYL